MSTLDFKTTLFVLIEVNWGSDYSGLTSMQVDVEVRYSKLERYTFRLKINIFRLTHEFTSLYTLL